jgi:hypothetical protein
VFLNILARLFAVPSLSAPDDPSSQLTSRLLRTQTQLQIFAPQVESRSTKCVIDVRSFSAAWIPSSLDKKTLPAKSQTQLCSALCCVYINRCWCWCWCLLGRLGWVGLGAWLWMDERMVAWLCVLGWLSWRLHCELQSVSVSEFPFDCYRCWVMHTLSNGRCANMLEQSFVRLESRRCCCLPLSPYQFRCARKSQ